MAAEPKQKIGDNHTRLAPDCFLTAGTLAQLSAAAESRFFNS